MISFPEQFNMADYFLDDRIKEGKGAKVAVYYEDKQYTYSEIQRMANRCGNALLTLGVEMEDRVLISLPDCPEFIASWFAIAKIGAVITMVNGGTGQETSRSSSGTILNRTESTPTACTSR
ncbi:MAG TPA: AMP-binding protein [Blastocatellia bacterium]|nr:AMP-binding protein [Blastocatellia bacterium]